MKTHLNSIKSTKHQTLRLLLLAIGLVATGILGTAGTASGQIVLSSSGTTGAYTDPYRITLSSGFSTGGTFSAKILVPDCVTLATNPSNQNYILTSIPRIPAYVPPTVGTNPAGYTTCQVMQTIQYLDGLGRPLQTIQVQGSTAGRDVVQPFAYDQFGREATKYLPYTTTTANDGSYKSDALTSSGQAAFYASPPPGVWVSPTPYTNPIAVTDFEASPLNRPVAQGAPGAAWQLGGGHTVGMGYGINGSGEVTLWTAGSGGASTSGSYTAGTLYKTTTTDENGNSTYEYKDMQGRVVCKKVYDGTNYLATNYVYDDLGNLAYVIPPGASTTGFAETDAVFLNFIYGYHYDSRNRLVEKKIPGKGWDYMVYNVLDQVVATQDANQRALTTPQWTFTKYDAQGRVTWIGLWNNGGTAVSRATLQSTVSGITTNLFESHPAGGSYTNISWPTTSIVYVLTVNYYDDYTFPGNPSAAASGSLAQPAGMLTATRNAVLKPDGTFGAMLWQVNYYDGFGRVIDTYKQHYLGGAAALSTNNYDDIQTTYNFDNTVATTSRAHYTTASVALSTWALNIGNAYFYDHMGRKTQTWTAVNGGTSILQSKEEYNELGQLLTKHLHSTNSGASFLQDIGYTYNERGWLTQSTAPLFAMQLKYNDGTTPQYNGNIANQYWGTPGSLSKNYTYSYDPLNRLTTGTGSTGNTENNITYDNMGNITQLYRYLGSTQVDQLTYSYSSTNQLQSITDATSNDAGLKHGTFSYAYDSNGNMTTDNSKGLSVSYNILNLPMANTITGGTISYTYDATGRKLRKESTLGSGTTTEYIDGIQYTGSTIDFVQTEEGRALNSGGTYHYEYNLADHLGDTRLSFDTYSGATSTTQQDDYLPFGYEVSVGTVVSPKNEYLYNHKELQEELGQYDYGARFYDPVIGRWTSVDPLAEKYSRWSPYNYGSDDPIRNTDPDGRGPCPECAILNIAFLKGVGQAVVRNVKALTVNLPQTVKGIASLGTMSGQINAGIGMGMLYQKTKSDWNSGNNEVRANILGNVAGEIGFAVAGSKGAGAVVKAVRGAGAAEATTTLFRGVNEAHPGFGNAMNGIAEPIGGNASAAAHNAGNTASPFTSWSTNPDVATNFALRPNGGGVMMETTVPTSSTVASPSAANVNLIQSPGTVVNESEVLLRGTVSGAKVTPVKPQL